MKSVMIFQVILCFFISSCKKDHKNILKLKAIGSVNTFKVEKKDTVKVEIRNKEQLMLDYALKAKEVKTLQDSAKYLKHYYNQFSRTKDSLSEILFFRMFPNSFQKYYNLTEYVFDRQENISYNFYYIHNPIDKHNDYKALRNYVSDIEYFNKLIGLGVAGKWEADDVSILQETINKSFLKSSENFIISLKKKNKLEIESFWIFFFDGPHPNDPVTVKLYEDVLNKLEGVEISMIPIVKKAYAEVKEDWGEH
jgi:hypothetical protein